MMRRKLVLLGEMAVGKTSVVRRIVLDRFDGDYKGTLGHDIFVYPMTGLGPNGDQTLELAIWDTDGGLGAGAFHFDASVKGASAIVIVGDVTRSRTLGTMALLAKECDTRLPGRPVYLLFNKMDLLGDAADYDIPAEFAGSPHTILKTSAKSGENIRKAFNDAANVILRRGL